MLFLLLWCQSVMWRELSVKLGLGLVLGYLEVVQMQVICLRMWHLIRVCTVCLNYRKLRVKWSNLHCPCSGPFSQPTLRDNQPTSVVSVWFDRHSNSHWKKSLSSQNELTFSTLWANSADHDLLIFFPENRLWHSMQIVPFHTKCENLFSGTKKERKYFKMSSDQYGEH